MVTSDTGLTVLNRDRPSRRFKSCPRHHRKTSRSRIDNGVVPVTQPYSPNNPSFLVRNLEVAAPRRAVESWVLLPGKPSTQRQRKDLLRNFVVANDFLPESKVP